MSYFKSDLSLLLPSFSVSNSIFFIFGWSHLLPGSSDSLGMLTRPEQPKHALAYLILFSYLHAIGADSENANFLSQCDQKATWEDERIIGARARRASKTGGSSKTGQPCCQDSNLEAWALHLQVTGNPTQSKQMRSTGSPSPKPSIAGSSGASMVSRTGGSISTWPVLSTLLFPFHTGFIPTGQTPDRGSQTHVLPGIHLEEIKWPSLYEWIKGL